MSRVLQTIEAIEARLAQIRVANGYHTDLGLRVVPSGQWLEEDDAPCVTVYEAAPGQDGGMLISYGRRSTVGAEAEVPYVVEAMLVRRDDVKDVVLADRAIADILRALLGNTHGTLPDVRGHRLLWRWRRLREKGGRILTVRVGGALDLVEDSLW